MSSLQTKSEPAEIEVILLAKTDTDLMVKTDEKSRPMTIPRRGTKILSLTNQIATLRMSERTAINYGLV